MSTTRTAPTAGPTRRRPGTALAGAVLATGALLAGAGTATAAPAPPSVVGTWSAVVDRGSESNTSTLIFAPSGKLCLRTESSSGTGSYVARSGYLAYRADERSSAGTVKINQAGTQNGNTFTTRGISVIYDTSGKRVGQTAVTVTATRTTTSTSGC